VRKLGIAVPTLGLLVAMALLRVSDLRWSREETLKSAEQRTANLATVASAYLGEAFAAGDASLRQLALHGRRVGGPLAPAGSWSPSLASAKAGLTSVGAITVVDADGIIRHSTRAEIVGQSRRGDYVIRAALEAANDDLVVGAPFEALSRPRQMLIPLGRRLSGDDGRPNGAVVASFVPGLPERFFRSLDVGERGAIWVFHPDGVVLFKEPSATARIGEPATANPIFAAAAEQRSGSLRGAMEDGGPVLLTAFHTMVAPRLVVAASLDQDEVLAGWWHEAIGSVLLFGTAAAALLVTLAVLFHQMDAKARAERALADAQRLESARLREANERLAAALEREQAARRDAEAASASKDEFLMMVSHELRTPLTAIYGWTRMLVAGTVGDQQRDAALRTIERNARAQVRLIDDLLDLSASGGGKLRLDVRQVDVVRVVEDAIETVGAAAEAKGIRITTRLDPTAGRLPADTDRLQQIVWNLLSNAVKFTPPGGRVEVAVSRLDRDVEIAVADTGIGIAPEFLPHVFERFRQAEGGSKRRFAGLGLGLAIVRNLVELHGGSVTVHSEGANSGSRFVVRLPAPAPHAAPVNTAHRPRNERAPLPRLDHLRVLVADDDPEARVLFTTILERAGATVTPAASAEEALTALRCASHDVLVSDIAMPGVDGYGLLREALAVVEERDERLTAVAVTAHGCPDDEAWSVAAGFHRHVHKPVDPQVLVAAVLSAHDQALHA
jgi:signal transduction histidine kinase/CheY-like chemotaxis protein